MNGIVVDTYWGEVLEWADKQENRILYITWSHFIIYNTEISEAAKILYLLHKYVKDSSLTFDSKYRCYCNKSNPLELINNKAAKIDFSKWEF